MKGLEGKHVFITGGGTGIGAAIAEALGGHGARLSLCGRRREPLEAVAKRLPQAMVAPADVGDEASLAAAFAAARAAHGPVDIAIANAGVADSAPFTRTSLERWSNIQRINLTGAFLTARMAMEDLATRGWGRMLFIASTAGLKGYGYIAPYCASKHGMIGLMRALAAEYPRIGVTFNAVCPGYTETPMLEATLANITAKTGRSTEEARANVAAFSPQGRFVRPEEVAAAVVWLCSPAADSVMGQAIGISGGET